MLRSRKWVLLLGFSVSQSSDEHMLRSWVKWSHSMSSGEEGTQMMKMSSICRLKSSRFF